MITASVDGQRMISHLPAITVRAMKDAAAIQSADSFDLRKVINYTCRQQQFPRAYVSAVPESRLESIIDTSSFGDLALTKFDTVVWRQLLAS